MKSSTTNITKEGFSCKSLIIGSFRKYYQEILDLISFFNRNGIEVLSPKESRILNPQDKFVIFAYDPEGATEREIEDAVLEKIHTVDFVYLFNPNGYIGVSASFEIGYCAAHDINVFAMERSHELCIKYVTAIKSPKAMVRFAKTQLKQ